MDVHHCNVIQRFVREHQTVTRTRVRAAQHVECEFNVKFEQRKIFHSSKIFVLITNIIFSSARISQRVVWTFEREEKNSHCIWIIRDTKIFREVYSGEKEKKNLRPKYIYKKSFNVFCKWGILLFCSGDLVSLWNISDFMYSLSSRISSRSTFKLLWLFSLLSPFKYRLPLNNHKSFANWRDSSFASRHLHCVKKYRIAENRCLPRKREKRFGRLIGVQKYWTVTWKSIQQTAKLRKRKKNSRRVNDWRHREKVVLINSQFANVPPDIPFHIQ